MVDEYNPPKKPLSTRDAVLSAIYIIVSANGIIVTVLRMHVHVHRNYKSNHFIIWFQMGDLVIYGCIIPLLGTYFAGNASVLCNLGPLGEVITVVLITFTLMYGAFCWIGEANYWKRLFAFDRFYSCLLQVDN